MPESLLKSPEGILLLDKEKYKTSFSLVGALRRIYKVKKIGHAGTLDPMATGVMVLLIGKKFTSRSDEFLGMDKEYLATLKLGEATDSFDAEGVVAKTSPYIPGIEEIENTLKDFQGDLLQIPPMFSAKKVGGKKLYELARLGKTIERKAVPVHVTTTFIEYNYPYLKLKFECSKGTYIRSLAEEIGIKLNSYAHLCELQRTRSGSFLLSDCTSIEALQKNPETLENFIRV